MSRLPFFQDRKFCHPKKCPTDPWASLKSGSQASESTLQSGFKHKFRVKISPLLAAPYSHLNLDGSHVLTCGSQKIHGSILLQQAPKNPSILAEISQLKKKTIISHEFMVTSIHKLCISKSLVRADPTIFPRRKGRRKLTPPVTPFFWCLRNHCYWKVASSCTIDSLVWRHERLLLASAQTFGWEVKVPCGGYVLATTTRDIHWSLGMKSKRFGSPKTV